MTAATVTQPRGYVQVDPAEACAFMAFTFGWGGAEDARLPVFVDGRPLPAFSLLLSDGVARTGVRLAGRARELEEQRGVQVEVGLPRAGLTVSGAPCVWVWVESPESKARAERFRPAPSLVLRFGGSSERLLVWGLRERVPYASLRAHSERLAYFLRAPRTRCDPEALRVPVPGSFLRVGRLRPAPVLVTRMELGEYELAAVTGRLRDAPPRDAWRNRS